MPSKKATKARSAVTGLYVDKQTAQANPRETVRESARKGLVLSEADLQIVLAVLTFYNEKFVWSPLSTRSDYNRISEALKQAIKDAKG